MSNQTSMEKFQNNFPFLFVLAIYFIVSALVFVLTSVGWDVLSIYLFLIPFYVIFLIISIVWSFFQELSVDRWRWIAALQALILLMNVVNCGASAIITFFQKLLEGNVTEMCMATKHSVVIDGNILVIAFVLYACSLFSILLSPRISGSGKR